MQFSKRILLIMLICVQLCGCSQSRQVENQAYVLAIGIDRQANGNIDVSALIPKIAGSSAEDATTASQGSQGNYLHVSVNAENYEAALENLSRAVPRNLNLSQLKMIVFSKELVEKTNISRFIEDLARTEQLFTAAQVTVCDGKASDFIKVLQPVVGNRLSTDMDATMDHYVRHGLLPDSTLADLFYLSHSVYSDPLTAFATAKQKSSDESAQPAFSQGQSIQDVLNSIDSDIKTLYLGSVMFRNGEFKGILNGSQTILANLLTNSLKQFRYTCDDECMEFTPIGKPGIKVNTNTEPVIITIDISLSAANQDKDVDKSKLEAAFKNDLLELMKTAQQHGVEPFGFAESAVRNFSTLSDWLDYNWHERFQNAKFEVKMDIQYANA